jgi:predicted  nucleic acid-binding Zn-ribbon protein
MKMKDLRKKIRRLEKRLREGPEKLAKLEERLEAAEAAKALNAARKYAVRAAAVLVAEAKKLLEAAEAIKALNAASKSAVRAAAVLIAEAKKPAAKKAKRKLNLSPERRAQLAAMKARWATKRAAEADAVEPSPQVPEDGHSAV